MPNGNHWTSNAFRVYHPMCISLKLCLTFWATVKPSLQRTSVSACVLRHRLITNCRMSFYLLPNVLDLWESVRLILAKHWVTRTLSDLNFASLKPYLTSQPSMYSNTKTVRNVPKDLGVFQTLVAGWEQVGARSHTPTRDAFAPSSPSASQFDQTIAIGLPLLSPTNRSKSSELKEQFLRDLSPTPFPTTPVSGSARTPTTPTYGGSGYRFAGVERLAQRQKIYEPQVSSPEANRQNISVSVWRRTQFTLEGFTLLVMINWW